mmetsp:Transcript_30875/g.94958  ORF Transcript_30875/g.94958 Transcript_30875/m.94958 type:complete len:313 (+) Transcript_30875:152-1090(+)
MGTWRAEAVSGLCAGIAGHDRAEWKKRLGVAKKGCHSSGRASHAGFSENLVRLLLIALGLDSGMIGQRRSGALRRAAPAAPVCAAWRLWAAKKSHIAALHDGTYAFSCTKREGLEITVKENANSRVWPLWKQRHEEVTVTVTTADGELSVCPTAGAPMGDSAAPKDFLECYNRSVAGWLDSPCIDSPDEVRWLHCRDPVTGNLTSPGIATYADDIAKNHLAIERYREQVKCKQEPAAIEEQACCRGMERTCQKEGRAEFMQPQVRAECWELDTAVVFAFKATGGGRKPGGSSRSATEREVRLMLGLVLARGA